MLKNLQFSPLHKKISDCCKGLQEFKDYLSNLKKDKTTIKKKELAENFRDHEIVEQLHLPQDKEDVIDLATHYERISKELPEYKVFFEALDQLFRETYKDYDDEIDVVDDNKLEKFLQLFRTTNSSIGQIIDEFVTIESHRLPMARPVEAMRFDLENSNMIAREINSDEVPSIQSDTDQGPQDDILYTPISAEGFTEEDDDQFSFNARNFIKTDEAKSQSDTDTSTTEVPEVDEPSTTEELEPLENIYDQLKCSNHIDHVEIHFINNKIHLPKISIPEPQIELIPQVEQMLQQLVEIREENPNKVTPDLEAVIEYCEIVLAQLQKLD